MERRRIMQDIDRGKPVLAINLRIAPEWGVITGYRENGKVFLCRTYFDREYLNEQEDYLETDFWPFLITHFGEKTEKPSESQILTASLQTLVKSFEAQCERGYYQGEQAYEKWVKGLRNTALWNEKSAKEDVDRRLGVNDSMLLNLIDARRCASEYLSGCKQLLNGEKAELLSEVAGCYHEMAGMVSAFREKLRTYGGEELRYNAIDAKSSYESSFREEQAGLLEKILHMEREIVNKVKRILE